MSTESWIHHIDQRFQKVLDHIDAAGHELMMKAGEMFENFLSMLGGGIANVGKSTVDRVDGFMDRASGSLPTTVSEMKKNFVPEKSPSITPDIAMQVASMNIGMQSIQQGVEVSDYNFSPHQTPGLGVQMGGQAYGIG